MISLAGREYAGFIRWYLCRSFESTAEVTAEAVQVAQKYGTIVSYDLNYRPSLWKSIGGIQKHRK